MFRPCRRTEDKEYKNGTECDLHGISIDALLLSKIIIKISVTILL